MQLIPVILTLFSLGGAVFGMSEETIPFIPIFVSLCIAMGYDSITGAAIVLCGAAADYAGAFMNPFTLQVAQGIAELPLNGDAEAIFGSSDAGNVSFACPTFHPCLQVAEKGVAIHTRAFAKAMKSQRANKALGTGAKVIAYQICKIFSQEADIRAMLSAGPDRN